MEIVNLLFYFQHFSLTLPNFVKRVSTCPMPKNFSEWKRAASRLGCDNFENAPYVYHCMPSSFLNETVEFCGRNVPHVGGSCPIYTYKFEENKAPNFRNCSEFKSGCPNKFYFSKMIYKYPACLDIIKDRMCYKADPSCCSNMSCSRPILSTNGGTNGSTEKW
ncbi:uncharacterized protein LOC134228526 [Saccostrea cucullata]|uniref:uncharacterized protein LOC134228526 n=1 Tax=Saccostrea cuccullata TaxID=36930 RepID=UPI002ED19130